MTAAELPDAHRRPTGMLPGLLRNPVDPERVEAFSRQLGCWSQTDRHRRHLRCGRHRVYLELHGCPVAVGAADLATTMITEEINEAITEVITEAIKDALNESRPHADPVSAREAG